MIVYILIETQDEYSEYGGDNNLGVYTNEERANKELLACEKEYEDCGHTYRIETFVLDNNTWLKGDE